MNVGTEWLVDAEGCRPELLRDVRLLRRVCEQIIADLDLHVIGDAVWHQFSAPGGVTGLFLLTESHLAFHTYPESRIATFNVYCCRPRPPWAWQANLGVLLEADHVTVRSVARGTWRHPAVPTAPPRRQR
jgi:S-adenosylmethionine decarboxylase